MYRFRKDGISVLAIVDRRYRKNNGLYPVKIEVVFRRVQKYYPTGIDVSFEEWEGFWKARRTPKKCASIENSFYLIRNAVEKLAEKGEFSHSKLKKRLGRSCSTVNDAFKHKMACLMRQGKINSFYRYRSTLNALEAFKGKNISFDSISEEWLEKCESVWMKDGKCRTTINIYMKALQCIFNDALDEGVITNAAYPFGKYGYHIPIGSSRKLALSKEQIDRIRRWSGNKEIEYWRDLWMFSYLCNGINFRDMIFLKYSNIRNGEIAYVRSKTRNTVNEPKEIYATITPLMREIMERSGNGADGAPDDFIFRHAKGNETPLETSLLVRKVISSCNAAMKGLASDLGIPPFSTYAARHSFATILKQSGTDIHFISESLGHSSVSMTETYISGYGKEERKAYANSLL